MNPAFPAISRAPAARLFVLAACLLALLGSASPARAEQASVHVQVAASKVYVGDPVEVQVLISGARNVPRPSIPASPDYDLAYSGEMDRSSFMTTIINGRMSQQGSLGWAHLYRLTAHKAGPIVIPAFDVLVDGKPMRTAEVRLTAVEPAETADFRLELAPSKPRVYEGEPLTLRLTWLVGKPIRADRAGDFSLTLPALPEGVEMLEPPDPRTTPGGRAAGQQLVRAAVNGEPTIATVITSDLNGQPVQAVTLERTLIAHAPGTLRFGPARADFQVITGERPRRFMDSPFEDFRTFERQVSTSKPFTLEVLPLPEAGRPADFSGLVGAYTVTASAEPRDVSVGEPITLRVTVNGPPPLSLVPPLDLTQQPALSAAFRVPRDPGLPVNTPVGAMFTSMIRARSAETTQIPPIALSFFDTESGTYKTASSPPIFIKVRPSTGVELPDLDEPHSAPAAARPSARVDTASLALNARSFDLRTAATSPSSLALAALPPLACGGVWLVGVAHRRALADPHRLRRRRAVRTARARLRRIRAGSDDTALAGAVTGVLTDLAADWFARPPRSLTSAEALALLTAASDPTAGDLADLLAACDRARFGATGLPAPASTPDHGSLLARAHTALDRVARTLEGRP